MVAKLAILFIYLSITANFSYLTKLLSQSLKIILKNFVE